MGGISSFFFLAFGYIIVVYLLFALFFVFISDLTVVMHVFVSCVCIVYWKDEILSLSVLTTIYERIVSKRRKYIFSSLACTRNQFQESLKKRSRIVCKVHWCFLIESYYRKKKKKKKYYDRSLFTPKRLNKYENFRFNV